MGKKRIHELAKELSMSSSKLISKIEELKLLQGFKLSHSNTIDDAVAEEIIKRLSGQNAGKTSPQVVRRRKKGSDQDSNQDSNFDSVQDETANEVVREKMEEVQAVDLKEKTVDVAAQRPVKIKEKEFERATIIAPPAPVQAKSQVNKNAATAVKASKPEAKNVPDFLRLVPSSQKTTQEPKKVVPVSKEDSFKAVSEPAVERKSPQQVVDDEKPRYAQSRAERSSKGSFESAKVVGVKQNWEKPKPAFTPSQNKFQAKPSSAPSQNRFQPKTESDGRKPFNKPKSFESKPTERFETVMIPLEENTARKRDKKKKNYNNFTEANEESVGKLSKRREIVERNDLYSEGTWERVKSKKNKKSAQVKPEITTPKAIKRRIKVDDVITVAELAHRLSLKSGDIIKKLMSLGVIASLNQSLDFDTATLVASDFGYEVEKSAFDEDNFIPSSADSKIPKTVRPPVVTIMGHVDHGKTSLLDYIRKTNIQSGEAGGITQHIGAYHVNVGERQITFLDTPGHEAFTSMRSRGAQVTDIVILIVAADDGVMPQTREAADHAKAANVPIIVAINKIDKPQADSERIRRQMSDIGLVQEEWGGDTVFVEVSAKSGQGVSDLLEMILLQADMLELQARAEGPAIGHIVEARLDKGRGPVATVLIQEGLVKQGDPYVCGVYSGRIRAMLNDQGERVLEAGPSMPVEIQGISGVPQAGDEFVVMTDEKQARQVSQHRQLRQREHDLVKSSKLTLENLFDNIKTGAVKGLNLIIKADVQGSLEAIVEAMMKLSTPELKINIIHQSTGAVSETDVMLASASNALIIGFGVRPPTKVQELADIESIQIRYYDIIYALIDDVKEAMAGLLAPVITEKVLGRAEVRATFMVTKVGMIAGSYVLDGKIVRSTRARLIRDGVVIHDGRISSLKRVKDDVKEVSHSYECGIGLENYNDIKVGDHIESYLVEETAATVDLVEEVLEKAAIKAEKDKQALLKAENNSDLDHGEDE